MRYIRASYEIATPRAGIAIPSAAVLYELHLLSWANPAVSEQLADRGVLAPGARKVSNDTTPSGRWSYSGTTRDLRNRTRLDRYASLSAEGGRTQGMPMVIDAPRVKEKPLL